MVSLRRRKLLGLCSGRNSFLTPLPKFSDIGAAPQTPIQSSNSVAVHAMPSDNVNQQQGETITIVEPEVSNVSGYRATKEQLDHQFPGETIKRRKRHRRKNFQNQEPCLMRGVYFKNMKWQAAIKVDKKQIHLGTVGSQEEAAHLYDRAAFMCGREPNFELPDEEKQELRKCNWDEFLAMTRHEITNKKHKRRVGPVSRKKLQPTPSKTEWDSKQGVNGEWDGEQGGSSFSTSEEVELDTSI